MKFLLFALSLASGNIPLVVGNPINHEVGPSLIVGGQEAARGAYPYYVDIFGADPNTPTCGGTLIAPRVVLTAQHCNFGVTTFEPTFVGKQVRVGAFDASGTFDGSRLVTVVQQQSHPLYREVAGLQNDFLLLRLAEDVNIENVNPKLRLSNLDSDIFSWHYAESDWTWYNNDRWFRGLYSSRGECTCD
jgi:secreted trypsin-like serine protease